MNNHISNDALQFLQQRLPSRLDTPHEHPQSSTEIVQTFRGRQRGEIPIEDPFDFADRSLSRASRRHLLLSGARGVGKTTFAHAYLARSVATHPERFERALWLDCRHVGPEDSRGCWESLITACSNQWKWLICLEGFVSMLERPQGGSNEPLVHAFAQSPHIRLIAIISDDERRELHGRGSRLMELFTPMELSEPSRESVELILQNRLEMLQKTYRIDCKEQLIERLMDLCDAYFLNRCYPAKACELLDHAFENATFGIPASSSRVVELGVRDLERAAQEMTGVAVQTRQATPNSVIAEAFNRSVFGQPEATRACGRELEIIRAGLNDANKPASVLMFAGTTGVGKTELAKTIAEIYSHSRKLHIYSMGNYTEPHSVSGIIGVPAGYVGHDEGGQLVSQLLADPFSVFLLDEAEKAHANVWKPFLTLFDEGWIVDQRGRKAYGNHAIFILTTNAGERTIQQLFQDGKPYDEIAQRVKETLVRFRIERSSQPVFSEQFLARINNIIVFRPLGLEAMRAIVNSALARLQQRWSQRMAIELEFADEFLEPLAVFCSDCNDASSGKEGGRIVRRTIRQQIENRLLEFLRNFPAEQSADPRSAIRLGWDEHEDGTEGKSPKLPRLSLEWIPSAQLVASVL